MSTDKAASPVLCRNCGHPIFPSRKHLWLHSPSPAGRRSCCNGSHVAEPVPTRRDITELPVSKGGE